MTRNATQSLPTADAVGAILSQLLDGEVSIEPGEPVTVTPKTSASVAVLVDDAESVMFVVVSDFPLTCHAGAALTMVDSDVVQEQLDAGVVDSTIAENYSEIVNVLSSVFNEAGMHFKLATQHVTPGPLPAPVVLALVHSMARLDLRIGIPDRGDGRMSIVLGRRQSKEGTPTS